MQTQKLKAHWLLQIVSVTCLIIVTHPQAAAIPISPDNRDYFESRISNETQNIYFANWTEDGLLLTDVNDTRAYGLRVVKGLVFYTKELDPSIAMFTEVVDNTTFRVMVEENPDFPYDFVDVPVTVCVYDNNTIKRANRFIVSESEWCDDLPSTTIYEFPRLRFNNWFTVEFESSPVNYATWFGGDSMSPQGGSSGLPTCEGNTALISVNETSIFVGEKFLFRIRAGWTGAGPFGCSLTSIEAQNLNDVPIWKVINDPSGPDSNLRCLSGSSCVQNSPAYDTWYNKYVECNATGNRTLRTRVFGSPNSPASVTKNIECKPLPVITAEEGVWLALFSIGGMMIITLLLYKRKENGS